MNRDPSPYRSPSKLPMPPRVVVPHGPPPVWPWFIAYCVAMGLMYVTVTVASVGFIVVGLVEGGGTDEDEILLLLMGGTYALIGAVLASLYLSAPFLPKRQWSWIWGLVTIVIGLLSPCCMLASIPLLIFWLKPETKQWYRMS